MNRIFTTLSTLVFAFSSSVAMADVAIIANSDTDVGDVDFFSVRNIFLGEKKSFPNGVYANPVHHTQGSTERKVFFNTILNMTEQAHDRYWKRKQKRNTVYRPAEADSHKDVLDEIATTSGGIGYVDARMVNDSVKVLMTIEADEAGLTGNVFARK